MSASPHNRQGNVRTDRMYAMFLVGFMGAGKTSVGREMACLLGWNFVDLDEYVVSKQGRTVAEIFREEGEAFFRRIEAAALTAIMSEVGCGRETVIAVGGGAFVQPENQECMKASGIPVVFLDADSEELRRRCAPTGSTRPLFEDGQRFRELYESRRVHYLRADIRVDTGSKTVAEVAQEVIETLGLAR